MVRARIANTFSLVLAVLVLASYSPDLEAGMGGAQAAGVIVDANGVLRTKIFNDPTGQLVRQRLEAARLNLHPEVARPSRLRKISLNRLEAAVAARLAQGQSPTDDMQYLAGLTRLTHVFFYPETGDIVVAGPAEGYMQDISGRAVGLHSGRSILELQDLVAALRAFSPNGRRANVISVSIDPTREGLTRMQQFLAQVGGRATPRDTARLVNGLRESLGLQKVSVRGVSPKTHFAQVLVEADYRMKLIGIGLERAPVDITSYVSRANPRNVSRNALCRWYFTPNYDCVRVTDDRLGMEIVGDGVKLVGQDELVQAGGQRVETNQVDAASKAFVDSFTAKYAALAERAPVYAQLRNMIDITIAAAYIQDQDFYGQANWQMSTFGNEQLYPIETYQAPEHVETAVNAIWRGRTLMTPIGGGVNIQARQALQSDRLLPDENGQLGQLRSELSLKELPADKWWWD